MGKSNKQLWAGMARREITPPVGTPLSGFIARIGLSTGIADPLSSRALVLSQGENTVVVVQLDLLGLAAWHVEEIRRASLRIAGVSADKVLISTTHTHSGPGMLSVRGCLVAGLDYQWSVVRKTIDTIRQAYGKQQPAHVRINRVPFALGINRRQKTATGVVLGVDRRKPAPKFLDVALVDMRGGDSCVLFSHAAHPYILGGNETLISGDFPSFACRFLEKSTGVTAMFLNGCAGDIAPLRAFQGVDAAREEGIRLARAVRQGLNGACEIRAVPINAASTRVLLPYAALPTLASLEQMKREQEHTVRPEERTNPAVTGKIRAALDDWADAMARVVKRTSALEPIFAEVQILRIGEWCLLAISGEPFFAIGQRICQAVPSLNLWILGYGNAYSGYLPTTRAVREGGYEVSESYRYLGIWRPAATCEGHVVKAAQKLLRELYGR
jgi:neutral ceramidase